MKRISWGTGEVRMASGVMGALESHKSKARGLGQPRGAKKFGQLPEGREAVKGKEKRGKGRRSSSYEGG